MTLQDSSCFSMIFLQIMSLSSKGSYGELYVRPYSTRLPIFLAWICVYGRKYAPVWEADSTKIALASSWLMWKKYPEEIVGYEHYK